MNRNMLGFMAVSLLVFFVLTGTLMNRVMSSVRKMVDSVLAIGAGDFQKQIREVPSPEFAPLVKAVNFLAQNIGENITTITRQKVELEAVFNGMREGVMILDDRMRIIGSNHSLQRIFPRLENPTGLTPMEATLVPELQEACQKLWTKDAVNGDPRTTSLVIKTQEGAYFDVNIVFLGEEHEDLGAVVVFHDVSEIKRAETLRRDFVGNVSHELRTPLTSIKGYAETLYGLPECGSKDARSFLDIILRNANMMNQMLEDLLALAKYESGEAGLDLRSIDLYSIVYSALKICRPNIREKKLRVDVEFKANEFQVRGDFDQLVQVVVNLVDNAVKYVAVDSGHIRIRAHSENEMVALAVEDNGSGIPQTDQDRVFERFYRVEKHRNRNIPGTGLGLSICRHIVRNHGGSIRLQSPVPGAMRGSVFIVELPTPEKYSGPEGNTE
jgi:two-component system phosphate regulon sensor histidine kinase PhoR